ncbi:MAG: DNA-directed RNA polymerase subunit omega [Victivallaceae bacterium]|jgi:DNA-directed RNA polymerase omega subunit|nr:DNA-directed RNA polymerase subunit omega [Victivallaceae bacterium]NLK83356.1 DNA-directed RNA polymerase subunit omega [Lentisphaerota bacterium]MDD3115920.1 DNA-directed RNA polymerase subunit omega [Victivallaceae bacterium]MDD3703475.1 DNA-directed RNA polymerase subunit omega [Victivallaceae bacterium]MDD4317971.1 DNA-directed RNA polymerase subunit omega [Victivallaceae bacterium]
MNNAYLERAKSAIDDPKILSLVAAKRAKQLALGMRPMVKCKSENWLDIALLEIAEGKLSYEFSDTPEEDIFADVTSDPVSNQQATAKKDDLLADDSDDKLFDPIEDTSRLADIFADEDNSDK